MVFAPVVVKVRLHFPALTGAVQLSDPDCTVTLPVSAAPTLPGGLTVTLQSISTVCPVTDGVLAREAAFEIVIVVSALLTVCETPDEVLLLKLLSPKKLAVIVLEPAVADVSTQLPCPVLRLNEPVHVLTPSLTVTELMLVGAVGAKPCGELTV